MLLLERKLRIVRRILDGLELSVIECGEPVFAASIYGLISGDHRQPCCNETLTPEFPRVAPDIKKHLADDILGHVFIPGEAQDEAVDPHIVPYKEGL